MIKSKFTISHNSNKPITSGAQKIPSTKNPVIGRLFLKQT